MPKHSDVTAKLADMDANGIAITALSNNDPGPEWFGSEGPAVARTMNDYIANIVRPHPTRFIGLCVLPRQNLPVALVCPHLGGTPPYIIGRLDHQTQVLKRGPKYLTRAPGEYLKQVWLDIVSPLPLAMRFGHDFMGADRFLFASDHPWGDPWLIFQAFHSLELPVAERDGILYANARKLFNI